MIELLNRLIEFFQSPIFHQLGLFGLLIYSALPSFVSPLPNETISAPLLIGGVNPLLIILVMSVGGLLGDILMFYIGKHVRRFFNKNVQKAKPTHFLHRHRYWFFVVTVPVPYVSESVMLYAGHQHTDLKKILPFIYLGELIRSIIGTCTVLGIMSVPRFL